jgi:nifR3 family TIM-barrel protein
MSETYGMIKEELRIGNVTVNPPTILAPLAGITSLPFRRMVKSMGCGLVVTEMISSKGLFYHSEKTEMMLESADDERPVSVQIFGADPGVMAAAAARVQDMGADMIDINFGCSVRKVMKTGAGVALMREPELAAKVIKAVRQEIRIPLTIKIRSGYESSGREAFLIAKIAQEEGVDAIAFHPRTAQQRFWGKADWALIAELKKRLSIPVIGNGDITTAADALAMIRETGCDGVMIGRAAMAYPEIFRDIACLLKGEAPPAFSMEEHFDMMENFVDRMIDYHGETVGAMVLRSRLCFLVKGIQGAVQFRKQLSNTETKDQVIGLLREFRAAVLSGENTAIPLI